MVFRSSEEELSDTSTDFDVDVLWRYAADWISDQDMYALKLVLFEDNITHPRMTEFPTASRLTTAFTTHDNSLKLHVNGTWRPWTTVFTAPGRDALHSGRALGQEPLSTSSSLSFGHEDQLPEVYTAGSLVARPAKQTTPFSFKLYDYSPQHFDFNAEQTCTGIWCPFCKVPFGTLTQLHQHCASFPVDGDWPQLNGGYLKAGQMWDKKYQLEQHVALDDITDGQDYTCYSVHRGFDDWLRRHVRHAFGLWDIYHAYHSLKICLSENLAYDIFRMSGLDARPSPSPPMFGDQTDAIAAEVLEMSERRNWWYDQGFFNPYDNEGNLWSYPPWYLQQLQQLQQQ